MSRIPLPYNPKVMDLFRNPKNLGKMEDATVVAVAGNPACGDMITFSNETVDFSPVATKALAAKADAIFFVREVTELKGK